MKFSVYLSLGSNVGKEHSYPRAVSLLASLGEVKVCSPVYQTVPVGMPTGTEDFFNGAVLLTTALKPEELKRRLATEVEAPLGRWRDPQGRLLSRTIDVDISLWGDQVIIVGGKPVPHPDILNHLHVAWPLAEIAPDVLHPVDGRTLAEIARELARTGPLPRLRSDVILEF